MKIPFLSRLLEIKETQMLYEKEKLRFLEKNNLELKNLGFRLSSIEAQIILLKQKYKKRSVL